MIMSELSDRGFASAIPLGSFILPGAAPGFRTAPAQPGPWSAPAERAAAASCFAPCPAPPPETDAYDQGFADGEAAAALAFEGDRAAIAGLAAAMAHFVPEPPDRLAAVLAETVDRLLAGLIGSAAVDAELLNARITAAAALVSAETVPSALALHPDDVALLAPAALAIPIVADAALPRGAFRLETGHGWLEDGPQVRLARLRAALDAMAAD